MARYVGADARLALPTFRASRHAIGCWLLFCGGSLLNTVGYGSVQPILVSLLAYAIGMLGLMVARVDNEPEHRTFRAVFMVSWALAGVAAIYANMLNDPAQTVGDAGVFYEISSGASAGATLADLRLVSDGAAAIIVWRAVYDAVAALGLERGRYVGILVNILAVAFSSVLALRVARRIYGHDSRRLRLVGWMCAGCGLFWLFAAMHMRDSMILVLVSGLVYFWVRWLVDPRLWRLLVIAAVSAAFVAAIAFLRSEFLFVPVAMAASGLGALTIARGPHRRAGLMLRLALIAGTVGAAATLLHFRETIAAVLTHGLSSYSELAATESGGSSLGTRIIVAAPLPVRLILGSVYLYVFPIPVWTGFQLTYAYYLFKTLSVLFFYVTIPLTVMGLLQLLRTRPARTPALVFLALLQVGVTLAIAATSLETRHLGAFLLPYLMLAALPDLSSTVVRARYRRHRRHFLGAVVAVHLAWAVLKLL